MEEVDLYSRISKELQTKNDELTNQMSDKETELADTNEKASSLMVSNMKKVFELLLFEKTVQGGVKRQFVPSDNSSQTPKSDNSSQATIRPILKKRQFVPIIKSGNSSPI